ncbi:hypothetical protein DC345_29375 [Paenibacillus taichungensis]|uniref:Cell wall hydrolase n=1 Tax=Paenibacillus taichungensis TaxID=484184 RepID=A0A329QIC9_9BACL|nr:hypothetical protein DC345_29375 [Paenibacillus taichungensis]
MIKSLNKSIIASILAFAMIFSFTFQAQAQESRFSDHSTGSNVDILVDNADEMVISATMPAINSSFARVSALASENATTTDITGTLTIDKNLQTMTLVTNEKSEVSTANQRTYDVVIHEVNSLGDINATFTDLETNESYSIEQDKLQASFAIPIGIVIGETLLAWLVGIGATLIVATETWVTVNEIRETLRQKKYEHYEAQIMGGKLYVGHSIDLAGAAQRLVNPMFTKAHANVWSVNSAAAARVARVAGGGATPVGPELNITQVPGFFYYAHYHTASRIGGHSFF